MMTDKSHFHYGRKDGEYHEFTEISKVEPKFSKIPCHFMKIACSNIG